MAILLLALVAPTAVRADTVLVMVDAPELVDRLHRATRHAGVSLVVGGSPTAPTRIQRAAVAQGHASAIGAEAALWIEPCARGFDVVVLRVGADAPEAEHVPTLRDTRFASAAVRLLGVPAPLLPPALPATTPTREDAAEVESPVRVRAGVVVQSTPRVEEQTSELADDVLLHPGVSARLGLTLYVAPRLRTEVFGTVGGVVDHGPAGSVGAGFAVRLGRVAFGANVAAAIVRNVDAGVASRLRMIELGFPVELGIDVGRATVVVGASALVAFLPEDGAHPGGNLTLQLEWGRA